MAYYKKTCASFLFLCFFSLAVFASQSATIFNALKKEGLQPSFQTLTSESLLFPYNIFLDFGNQGTQTLFIVILQEEFDYFFENIVQLAHYFEEYKPNFLVRIALTANNTSPLPEIVENYTQSGIQKFIASINRAMPHAVLLLNKSDKEKVEIIPASRTHLAPLWLLKTVEQSTKEDSLIPAYSLLLYRLGILGKDSIYYTLLSSEIPTLLINIQNEFVNTLLQSVILALENTISFEWDKHYSFFYFGDYLYVSETITLIFILGTIGFLLFFLFMFSFAFGSTKIQRVQDLKKTWYLMPLMIIGLGSLLALGQVIGKFLFPLWENQILLAAVLKIAIAIIFFSCLTLLQRKVHFPSDEYIYGYLLILSALFNIIIFSSFSLSFFYNFLLIFMLSYFVMLAKKLYLKIFWQVLMTLPIVYFLFYVDQQTIKAVVLFFINLPFWGNVLFSCMLLPYEIICIMLLVRFNLFGKKENTSFPYIITSSFLLALTVTLCIVSYQFFITDTEVKQEHVYQKVQDSLLDINFSQTVSLDKSRIYFKIDSKKQALRYIVSVSAKNGVSVYDANFPYEISSDYTESTFLLDDNPPQTLKIDYSSDLDKDKEFSIIAYYAGENSEDFFYETKAFFIKGKND
ncbi:MAG: hypothetical protein ACRC4W_05035 [Treponemataceae bacterium]